MWQHYPAVSRTMSSWDALASKEIKCGQAIMNSDALSRSKLHGLDYFSQLDSAGCNNVQYNNNDVQ